jgi:hypothetical protein
MFSQVDDEGHRHILLKDITDYRKDQTAVDADNAFITMRNGVKRRRQTTHRVGNSCASGRMEAPTGWLLKI